MLSINEPKPAYPLLMELSFLLLLADTAESAGYAFWPQFIKMMFLLIALLGLVVGTAYFLKRFKRLRLFQANHTNHIKIMERRALGPKTFLYLIEIGGRSILIADSPNGLRTIADLPALAYAEELSEQPTATSTFFNRIRKQPVTES